MRRPPVRLEASLTTEYVGRNDRMRSITEHHPQFGPGVTVWWVVFGLLFTAISLIVRGQL